MESGNRFSQCLLERKDEESRQAKRLRRRTVLIAILIQVVVLSLLMLRPLFGAEADQLMIARLIPLPPWRGAPAGHKPDRPRPPQSHPHVHDISPHTFTFRPPERPADHLDAESAPDIGPASDAPSGPGWGDPTSPLPNLGLPGPDRPLPPPSHDVDVSLRKPKLIPSEIQEAKLVTRVEPVYPVIAKQIRLEGTVVIRAIIAKDGTVESLETLNGHPLLARAAMDAIVRWRYRPTLLNGQPVEVETLVTVIFHIQ